MILILNPVSGDSDMQRLYDGYSESAGPTFLEESTDASFLHMQPRSEVPYVPMNEEDRGNRMLRMLRSV